MCSSNLGQSPSYVALYNNEIIPCDSNSEGLNSMYVKHFISFKWLHQVVYLCQCIWSKKLHDYGISSCLHNKRIAIPNDVCNKMTEATQKVLLYFDKIFLQESYYCFKLVQKTVWEYPPVHCKIITFAPYLAVICVTVQGTPSPILANSNSYRQGLISLRR